MLRTTKRGTSVPTESVLQVLPSASHSEMQVLCLDVLATAKVAGSDLGVDLDLRVLPSSQLSNPSRIVLKVSGHTGGMR